MTHGVGDPGLVASLNRALTDALDPVIAPETRCALLGFPDDDNVGDTLIWLGALAYLRQRRCPVVATCSRSTYSQAELERRLGDGTIFITGGGNFGTLWPEHHQFRLDVVGAFPHRRIIQLPQSINFQDDLALARTASVLDAHPDFVLLARDDSSLAAARHAFRAEPILCPDMAFALGPVPRPLTERDEVRLRRNDLESSAPLPQDPDWVHVVRRWRRRHPTTAAVWWAERQLGRGLHRMPALARWLWTPGGAVQHSAAVRRFAAGCAYLGTARVAITDRLHGHILCELMGVDHVLVDDRNSKISDFRRTWTAASGRSRLASSWEEASAMAGTLVDT